MRYEIFLTKSAYSVILFVKVILVGGSTRIPKVQELLKDYFGKEPSRDINPDEAIVFGATIEAASRSGQIDNIAWHNIYSLNLGIEVNGREFIPIIERNTQIPMTKSRMYVVYFHFHSSFLMDSSVVQLLLTTNLL